MDLAPGTAATLVGLRAGRTPTSAEVSLLPFTVPREVKPHTVTNTRPTWQPLSVRR